MGLTEEQPISPWLWKSHLRADLDRQLVGRPWSLALITLGWIHLGYFMVCQYMFERPEKFGDIYYLGCWAAELATVLVAYRQILGRGWAHASPLIGLSCRVWITFLILSFSVAMLNTLQGSGSDWFKLIWCTLSTFGFAVVAYLISAWLFVPAVQMFLTGLIMLKNPTWSYLIYGISWCLAMHIVGALTEVRRRRCRDGMVPDGTIRVQYGTNADSSRARSFQIKPTSNPTAAPPK